MAKRPKTNLQYKITIFEADTTRQALVEYVVTHDFAAALNWANEQVRILNREWVREWEKGEGDEKMPAGPYYEVGSIEFEREVVIG